MAVGSGACSDRASRYLAGCAKLMTAPLTPPPWARAGWAHFYFAVGGLQDALIE